MSGSGQAASAAARPASVVMSPATGVTVTPVAARISAAVRSSTSAPRAVMTTSTPSRASAMAQARARNAMGAGFNGTEKTETAGGTGYGLAAPTAAQVLTGK